MATPAIRQSSWTRLRAEYDQLPFKSMGRELYKRIRKDDLTTLSMAFAYNWVFSIPAMMILVVMVAALLNRVTDIPIVDNLRELIDERAPADLQLVLNDLVDSAVAEVGGGIASIGAVLTGLLAIWSASNAVGILVHGFNRAYGVDEGRGYLRRKTLLIGLTLLVVLFVNVAFASLVFGEQIGKWLADWVGLGSAFETTWAIARWPVSILAITVLLAFLYWAGPDVAQPFRWVSLGSIVAMVLWLVVVGGFSVYLQIADPGSAYGALGSVIVLLFFLYLSGLVFFLGAEVNAVILEATGDVPVGRSRLPGMVVANQ